MPAACERFGLDSMADADYPLRFSKYPHEGPARGDGATVPRYCGEVSRANS